MRPNDGGFSSRADFFAAVRNWPQVEDPRLAALASGESSGSDGGLAAPPAFADEIMAPLLGPESVLGRCDVHQFDANTVHAPVDESSPWEEVNGMQVGWRSEGSIIGQSKPDLSYVTQKGQKLIGTYPVTDEVLEDGPMMAAHLRRKPKEKIGFKIDDTFTWGNGVGQPLGFMNSPALVIAAAEAGPQTADTINAANISKMAGKLLAPSWRNAVWMIHPDGAPQVFQLAGGPAPFFTPGDAEAPAGRLLGRPIIFHETCKQLGDLGDIMLVDWSYYFVAMRKPGLKEQVSIHIWFDRDISAFKFSIRIAGQPWLSAPVLSKNGGGYRSPFVSLGAR